MPRRLVTLLLLIGIVACTFVVVARLRSYPPLGYQTLYEPEQPIAFSHRQHAGDLQIACVYCHYGAEKGRHAGIPPSSICMTCHRFVTAPQKMLLPEILEARCENRPPKPVISPSLQKLYDAVGLDAQMERDPNKTPKPIEWVKVHNLPSYTCFDHKAHLRADVACQRCHGPVETMDRMRQFSDLSMGWCVNCHRETQVTGADGKTIKASIDCAVCHH